MLAIKMPKDRSYANSMRETGSNLSAFVITLSRFKLIDRINAVKTAYKISEAFTHPESLRRWANDGKFSRVGDEDYITIEGEEILK